MGILKFLHLVDNIKHNKSQYVNKFVQDSVTTLCEYGLFDWINQSAFKR